MEEVTRKGAIKTYSLENAEIKFVKPPEFVGPKLTDRVTPFAAIKKFPDGKQKISVTLPNCAFFNWAEHGKPSYLTTLVPDHPNSRDIPARRTLKATEMYDEPFHVPEPDEVVLDETWKGGEYFRSGCVWHLGQGKVFYFRPGDEDYNVFKQKPILQIIENACLWLAK